MIVEEFWKQPYVCKRDWILHSFESLELSEEETLMLMMIDFMNSNQMFVSHETLALKLKKTVDDIDKLFTVLEEKGYLEIAFKEGKMLFSIDPLFQEEKKSDYVFDQNLFDLFEEEFGRTLNQRELGILSDWISEYDKELIIFGLREMRVQEVASFEYLDRVLQNWKEKGFSADDYKEGRR